MAVSVKTVRRVFKPVFFLLALLPALWLVWNWYLVYAGQPNALGFNPNEASNRFTGDWAIRMLLITLALTPLSRLIKSPKPILFRRMTGLFTLFYAVLHITSYVWLDMLFDWGELWKDIVKRTYITIGMGAFLLLIPLGATSTKGWIRRMGAKRWQRLHKAVYVIGILACTHFIMMRKGFQLEPLVYLGLYLSLMAARYRTGKQARPRR